MKTLTILVLCLVALPLFAQEATITAPDTTTSVASKIRVGEWQAIPSADCRCVRITLFEYNAASGFVGRRFVEVKSVDGEGVPTWTDFIAFHTALTTARATETGAAERRLQFRLLGFLTDKGLLSGVTIAP